MSRILASVLVVVFFSQASTVIAAEEWPTPEDISFVQGLLTRLGYDPGPADGICGDRTVAAVRALHDEHNLPLQPGHIEPQAAAVVENLTVIIRDRITQPGTQASEIYREALEGNAESAFNVGTNYFRGGEIAADYMLAYFWWTIAEMNGVLAASELKEKLITAGQVTDHEAAFATSLAEQISAPKTQLDQTDKTSNLQATM